MIKQNKYTNLGQCVREMIDILVRRNLSLEAAVKSANLALKINTCLEVRKKQNRKSDLDHAIENQEIRTMGNKFLQDNFLITYLLYWLHKGLEGCIQKFVPPCPRGNARRESIQKYSFVPTLQSARTMITKERYQRATSEDRFPAKPITSFIFCNS